MFLKPFKSSGSSTVGLLSSPVSKLLHPRHLCAPCKWLSGQHWAAEYCVFSKGQDTPAVPGCRHLHVGDRKREAGKKLLVLKPFQQTWLLQYSVELLLLVMELLSVQDSVTCELLLFPWFTRALLTKEFVLNVTALFLLVALSSAVLILHKVMFVSNVCENNVISPQVQNQLFK